jgi:hypothetical protein
VATTDRHFQTHLYLSRTAHSRLHHTAATPHITYGAVDREESIQWVARVLYRRANVRHDFVKRVVQVAVLLLKILCNAGGLDASDFAGRSHAADSVRDRLARVGDVHTTCTLNLLRVATTPCDTTKRVCNRRRATTKQGRGFDEGRVSDGSDDNKRTLANCGD